jgi:hypothetical protein
MTIIFLTACQDNEPVDHSGISRSTQAIDADKVNIKFPVEAKLKTPDQVEDTLIATVKGIDFLITPTGKLFWGRNPGDTIHIFPDEIIEKAYLYLNKDILYLFYTETDFEGATSRLEKIHLTSKKRILTAEIPGFNLGLPYVVDNHAYVTAIGTAGKLNLDNGQYAYLYSKLYDHKKFSFNSFDSIVFKDDLTIFLSTNRNSKRVDSLIVNEKTNKHTIRK